MDRVATALAQCGIAVSQAHAYATTPHAPHALRLGLGSVPLPQLEAELVQLDRKSTRLNSSHSQISYAVFCLKKKNDFITAPRLNVPGHAHPDRQLMRLEQ